MTEGPAIMLGVFIALLYAYTMPNKIEIAAPICGIPPLMV